jgi:hypothetical protein
MPDGIKPCTLGYELSVSCSALRKHPGLETIRISSIHGENCKIETGIESLK